MWCTKSFSFQSSPFYHSYHLIPMSSIFRFVMAGLGVMEFVNAAMCWTSQTEVYTANVFIGNGLPFYDPIIPHLMAVYSWALIGLGR